MTRGLNGKRREATTRPRRRHILTVGAFVLALVAGLLAPAIQPQPADAANAADWDPGYIIDDAVFYDGNAMSATDVQAFLNTRIPSCNAGYTCLNGYGQATGPIAADRFCDGYQPAPYETAAQIIDKVARSCGISQRVLLVLLEKEQGLVTSRSPSAYAYRAATGMACPDTAPCDPSFSGFFYQVYYGARQFEVYRLNPTSFNHRAGQVNNIRYHPDAGCGTKSVYIYNQATAGLYNYTPYTPDDAALANLYGAAGYCSTYGNRNFWRLFTDWFGNPKTYAVHAGLQSYWSSHGGASGPIGNPISYAVYVEQNGQGWYQRFQGGNLYGSFYGGTVFVANNVILAEYNRHGGPNGAMGFPNGEQQCATGIRCSQSFVSALISSTSQYGAHVLWGGFRSHWLSTGGTTGQLGAALNDMAYYDGSVGSFGIAWTQSFQAGVLVQTTAGFQLVPYSSILNTWIASGGGTGSLGWPTSAYSCTGSNCTQSFSGGVLASTPWYGAQAISGGFVAEWQARGGLGGSLGAPYGPMRSAASPNLGWAQNFAAGILTQSAIAGFRLVPYGPGQAVWTSTGEFRGGYGWPTGERTCVAGGCFQEFAGGLISDSSWGAYATYGGLAAVWKSSGAAAIGPAINPVRYTAVNGGGWAQHFSSGIITQSAATGAAVFTPYGPIVTTWYRYGAENTWLGWPTGAQTCGADGNCVQQFQNGVARSDAGGGVSFTR